MKNQVKKKSRRDFLRETSGALVASMVSLDGAKGTDHGFSVSETPSSETLFDYIERVAPSIEVFPWRALCPDFFKIHRVATLTFDRYFEFYQFKKRILESKKFEIEECVQKIDEASSRSKALILTGIYLYDCVYHENSRLFSFQRKRRNYGKDYLEMISRQNQSPPPPNSSVDLSVYRCYYPYRFPVYCPNWRIYRPMTLIGSPRQNHEIDESDWKRWTSLFERFHNANDEAFPQRTINYEDYLGKIEIDERFKFIEPPVATDQELTGFPPEILEKIATTRLLVENIVNWFWNQWLASIDKLLEQVQDILHMKLTAIMWATDDATLADVFLEKADNYLNSNNSKTDQTEYDLIAAAREYWSSIQSWVNSRVNNWGDLPVYDVLGITGSRLKDVATWLGALECH